MTENPEPATGSDESPPPTPRWVVVFGIIIAALIAIFAIVHLAGGGFHGHMPR